MSILDQLSEATETAVSAEKRKRLLICRALEKGIKTIVFDRGGFKFHGRMKALADAAREAGLVF